MTTTPTSRHHPAHILQPDDREIIRLLSEEFLMLTPEQLFQLLPERPRRSIYRRLQTLIRTGYLSVRLPGIALTTSTRPAYYLSSRAPALLAPDQPDSALTTRSLRARTYADSALPHLHLTSLAHIAFRNAEHHYPDYNLLLWSSPDDPIWAQMSQAGYDFRPDATVAYAKGALTFHAFLEIDRGTYRGHHLRSRLLAYRTYANKHGSQPQFQFAHPRFRVLFITETSGRLKHLLKHFAPHPPDLFWTTSWQRFAHHPLFHPHWYSHDSLTPRSLEDPYELPPMLPDPPTPPVASPPPPPRPVDTPVPIDI